MSLLESVNAMKSNIESANALVEQISALHASFAPAAKQLEGLDVTKTYFGINEDGTATLLSFDLSNGAPKFATAFPLPAEGTTEEQEIAQLKSEPTPAEV